MLARITRGPSGFDIRTFECPACNRVYQRVVALGDPMKSPGNRGLAPGRIASANVGARRDGTIFGIHDQKLIRCKGESYDNCSASFSIDRRNALSHVRYDLPVLVC